MRIFVVLLLCVTACAPPVYYRPGATQADFQNDQIQCRAEAYARAPYQPSGGALVGTQTDASVFARQAFFDACLANRGWQKG